MNTTATRERPIIFSAPMVQAIIAGTKTQTRRVVKPHPMHPDYGSPQWDRAWIDPSYQTDEYGNVPCLKVPFGGEVGGETTHRHFPFCDCGDTLWVREAWCWLDKARDIIAYKAEYDPAGGEGVLEWKAPMFMARRHCRVLLEVTDIRVQRVQDISFEDMRAEMGTAENETDLRGWQDLWDRINGKKHPWASNPWVWAITFKRVENQA